MLKKRSDNGGLITQTGCYYITKDWCSFLKKTPAELIVFPILFLGPFDRRKPIHHKSPSRLGGGPATEGAGSVEGESEGEKEGLLSAFCTPMGELGWALGTVMTLHLVSLIPSEVTDVELTVHRLGNSGREGSVRAIVPATGASPTHPEGKTSVMDGDPLAEGKPGTRFTAGGFLRPGGGGAQTHSGKLSLSRVFWGATCGQLWGFQAIINNPVLLMYPSARHGQTFLRQPPCCFWLGQSTGSECTPGSSPKSSSCLSRPSRGLLPPLLSLSSCHFSAHDFGPLPPPAPHPPEVFGSVKHRCLPSHVWSAAFLPPPSGHR